MHIVVKEICFFSSLDKTYAQHIKNQENRAFVNQEFIDVRLIYSITIVKCIVEYYIKLINVPKTSYCAWKLLNKKT